MGGNEVCCLRVNSCCVLASLYALTIIGIHRNLLSLSMESRLTFTVVLISVDLLFSYCSGQIPKFVVVAACSGCKPLVGLFRMGYAKNKRRG